MRKAKIAVMVSGGGTNLQALIDAEKSGIIKSGTIVLVISNNPNAYALHRAEEAGIKSVTITKRGCGSREAFEDAIDAALREAGAELVILAGFMSILSEEFIKKYDKRIILAEGMACAPGYLPHPIYMYDVVTHNHHMELGMCPNAVEACKHMLFIPWSEKHTKQHAEDISKALHKVLGSYKK